MHRSTVSGWDGVAAFLGLKHSNRVACLAFFVGENNGDLDAGDAGLLRAFYGAKPDVALTRAALDGLLAAGA